MNSVGIATVLALAMFQAASVQTTPATQNLQAKPAARLPDGEFTGLERLKGMGEPHVRWFHENTLVVRGTDVILDMNPVSFHNGKKYYSASDGGFLTYRGRLFFKDGQTFISLRLFQSDYILFPEGPGECEPYSRLRIFPVRQVNGMIEINGVRYKPTTLNPERLKEFLRSLHDEPAEYGGHPYRSDSHAPPCKSQ